MATRNRLLLVGFPREAFAGSLPQGVRRAALGKALGAGVPLLVHARAYPDLVRRGLALPFPLIVVYRPTEVTGTSVVAPFVLDDVSGAAGFEAFLETFLTLLPLYEAVHDVPEEFFRRLRKSARLLEPGDVPMPNGVRRRVEGDAQALGVFRRLLERRRARHALLVTPPARVLLRFLRGELSHEETARIAEYVEGSPAAQAKLIALREAGVSGAAPLPRPGHAEPVPVEPGSSIF